LRAVRKLADAGIRVGVAIAPVLPHLTDDRAGLEAVVAAAAEAGASFAWHGVLNLGDVTRESFFNYLAAEQSHLIATYREMYRSRYAPASYIRTIGDRTKAARQTVQFKPPQQIVPAPSQEMMLPFPTD
jgi:DNA repair photolyase